MSLSKTVEIATLELGVCEEPVNRVKYNTAYYGREVSGSAYPWCVTFLWWVYQQAGERMAFFGGGKTASCSMLLRWYREQGLTVPVSEVQVGDIVLLNFNGKSTPDHCGLVVDKHLMWKHGATVEDIMRNDWTYQEIKTIEGNTTPGEEGSQDNGGCVAKKTRFPYQIVDVCRPQYKDEEPPDDITGRWSEADIRWCIANGLMEGYPDGSWKPKQAVTREELAVVLRRFHRFMEDDGK